MSNAVVAVSGYTAAVDNPTGITRVGLGSFIAPRVRPSRCEEVRRRTRSAGSRNLRGAPERDRGFPEWPHEFVGLPPYGPPMTGRTAPSRAATPSLRCSECGWQTRKWVGRCAECGAWSSLIESAPARATPLNAVVATPPRTPAQPIGEVDLAAAAARGTGVSEFDRVLGGGLVPGGVLLLAGEPGVGKSTLLLEVASKVAAAGGTTLYVTGEESAAQVRLRAERVNAVDARLMLAAETELSALIAHVDAVCPPCSWSTPCRR